MDKLIKFKKEIKIIKRHYNYLTKVVAMKKHIGVSNKWVMDNFHTVLEGRK